MHIASALNVPTVGLFGPGSLPVFRAVGRRTVSISHEFPCSPCYMQNCIRPHDTCMQAITVDEVIQETGRLVSDGATTEMLL
jgi:ADP-heptose:LPS heptosyltransferase